jgi:hypothetical protein
MHTMRSGVVGDEFTGDQSRTSNIGRAGCWGLKAVLAPWTPDKDVVNAHGALKRMLTGAGLAGMRAPPLVDIHIRIEERKQEASP